MPIYLESGSGGCVELVTDYKDYLRSLGFIAVFVLCFKGYTLVWWFAAVCIPGNTGVLLVRENPENPVS
jgi:hypothetical protein